jgi:cytochrome c-type biogenesis protein CcmH/NrfG
MQATELDPTDTTARLNIGTVLIRAGVYDRAKLEFQAVLEREPKDIDALLGLATALRGSATRGDKAPYLEAESTLKKLLQLNSRHPEAAFNLGVLYADFLQKPKQAREMLERFLDNAPRAHPARDSAKKLLASLK